MRFIRFVVGKRSQNPWWLTGVITIAKGIRHEMSVEDKKVLSGIFKWYNENIPCPPFKEKIKAKEWTLDAVAWWRSTAKEPIRKLRELNSILRKHGLMVRMLQADYPGKIVYRDKYQVVAETPMRK